MHIKLDQDVQKSLAQTELCKKITIVHICIKLSELFTNFSQRQMCTKSLTSSEVPEKKLEKL
jgi:hypothetical protein